MLVEASELRRFAVRSLRRVGVEERDAKTVADVLLSADLRGIDSHGVARLRRYVEGLQAGAIQAASGVRIVTETAATATLDAANGLGQPAAVVAVGLAVAKARETGAGVVTCRNSNHFGIAGYYARLAARQGMLSIVTTNASPQVAPTHGSEPMYGTNPIAVALPTGAEPFSFDAATSAVPRGRLERLQRQDEPMLPGWAIDPSGATTTDITGLIKGLKGRDGHSLLPLGGSGEDHGGHKGYGLGLIVDLLCGPLAGALWGRHVYEAQGAGLGHFFFCTPVDAFGPAERFREESQRMFAELRQARRLRADRAVRIPGERGVSTASVRERVGIPLRPLVVADLERLAAELQVEPPFFSSRCTGLSVRPASDQVP